LPTIRAFLKPTGKFGALPSLSPGGESLGRDRFPHVSPARRFESMTYLLYRVLRKLPRSVARLAAGAADRRGPGLKASGSGRINIAL